MNIHTATRRLLIAAFVGVYALLIWQNLTMRRTIADLEQSMRATALKRSDRSALVFSAGDKLAGGEPSTSAPPLVPFVLEGRDTVFYFDPTCETCDLAGQEFENTPQLWPSFIFLSRGTAADTANYLKRHGLEIPVVYLAPQEKLPVWVRRKSGSVPQIFHIGRDGVVDRRYKDLAAFEREKRTQPSP